MRSKKARVKDASDIDNSQIEAFADALAQIVNQWNDLNAERAQGKFVSRLEDAWKLCPRKTVHLLADTSRETMPPCEITLFLIEFDETTGSFLATIPGLSVSWKKPITLQRLRKIIEDMDPDSLREP